MTRTLADFLGTYDVTRKIDDRYGGQVMGFDGRAEITATQDGASYREVGRMEMPDGQVFQAERSYVWIRAGALVHVTFADGSAFHDFDPETGGAASEHLCGEDMYRGGYDFTDWPNWTLVWDVEGPRKDYRSVSRYSIAR